MPELLGFVVVGVWIYCLVDIVTSRRDEVRTLPKWAWFLLALVIPLVGVPVWFFFGRPQRAYNPGQRWPGSGGGGERPARPQLPRRSRAAPAERVDDEATIRARIAERDELLARWAEEDSRSQPGDAQP